MLLFIFKGDKSAETKHAKLLYVNSETLTHSLNYQNTHNNIRFVYLMNIIYIYWQNKNYWTSRCQLVNRLDMQ